MTTQATTPNRPARLFDAKPGDQLVKVSGRTHNRTVVTVAKVWKSGVIVLQEDPSSTYDAGGFRRGRSSTWSSSPFIRPFAADETPESIIAAAQAARAAAKEKEDAAAETARQRRSDALARNADNIARMVTMETPVWGETIHVLDFITENDERKTVVFHTRTEPDFDWQSGERFDTIRARVAGAGFERYSGEGERFEGWSSWSTVSGRTMQDIIAEIIVRA